MKTVTALLGAAAVLSSLAATAPAMAASVDADEILFAYDLDRDMLTTEGGAAAVYADLVREARAACTLKGVRGFDAVDEVCAAGLVDAVVAASGSLVLEGQYAGSQYAAIVGGEVARYDIVSR